MLALAMALVVAASCTSRRNVSVQAASTGRTAPQALDDEWSVTHVAGAAAMPTGVLLRMDITTAGTENGRPSGGVTASAGCSAFGASLVLTPTGGFRLEDIGSAAEPSCPPDVAAIQAQFLTNLAAVQTYRLDGDELTLLGPNAAPLVTLERGVRPRITGVDWRLMPLDFGGRYGFAPVSVKISFSVDSSIAGDFGCVTFTAAYSLARDEITISDLKDSVPKDCQTSAPERWSKFAAILGEVARVDQANEGLILLSASLHRLLAFSVIRPSS